MAPDGYLRMNDTPARISIPTAANRLASSSSDDLARGSGKFIGNVAMAITPMELAAGAKMSSFGKSGYVVAAEGGSPLTGVRANQLAGASREALVRSELAAKYPGAVVQNEVYLRTVSGAHAIDPLTGTARRIDSIVIQNGRVVDSVEVTSLTANKTAQIRKEFRIRNNGGTFIRDRATGQLIDLSQTPTQVIRRQ